MLKGDKLVTILLTWGATRLLTSILGRYASSPQSLGATRPRLSASKHGTPQAAVWQLVPTYPKRQFIKVI